MGDVAHIDGGAPDHLDGKNLDLDEQVGAGVEHDRIFGGADLRCSSGTMMFCCEMAV